MILQLSFLRNPTAQPLTVDWAWACWQAQFGQPEIKLGVIPGAGGTQRLTKAVGKSKAMELALTGEFMGAAEAESYNLVSRVVPADDLSASRHPYTTQASAKSLLGRCSRTCGAFGKNERAAAPAVAAV